MRITIFLYLQNLSTYLLILGIFSQVKILAPPTGHLTQATWHNFEKCNTNVAGSKYHCLFYNFVFITRCFDLLTWALVRRL
jgi:hypothetical protein